VLGNADEPHQASAMNGQRPVGGTINPTIGAHGQSPDKRGKIRRLIARVHVRWQMNQKLLSIQSLLIPPTKKIHIPILSTKQHAIPSYLKKNTSIFPQPNKDIGSFYLKNPEMDPSHPFLSHNHTVLPYDYVFYMRKRGRKK
jgi:hypothetical protein